MAFAKDFESLFGDILGEMGQVTELSAIRLSTPISQLDLDSLSMLEFLMLLEERTGVEVTTDELDPDTTLAQLAEMLKVKSA